MYKLWLIFILTLFPIIIYSQTLQIKDDRVYEIRIYYAHPGKFEDLQRRFRQHTTKFFEKHGITSVGYWVPLENLDNKLIYILSYPSKEDREKSWKAFTKDHKWKKAKSVSEANGSLVTKVESSILKTTGFSPRIAPDSANIKRVFELRTYTTHPGKLNDLLARFRNHTMALFEKHGMTNVGYWVPTDRDKGAENTLIYILSHKSKEAGEHSFRTFGEDPEWITARNVSEANGPIVIKVESIYMAADDYSPLK